MRCKEWPNHPLNCKRYETLWEGGNGQGGERILSIFWKSLWVSMFQTLFTETREGDRQQRSVEWGGRGGRWLLGVLMGGPLGEVIPYGSLFVTPKHKPFPQGLCTLKMPLFPSRVVSLMPESFGVWWVCSLEAQGPTEYVPYTFSERNMTSKNSQPNERKLN